MKTILYSAAAMPVGTRAVMIQRQGLPTDDASRYILENLNLQHDYFGRREVRFDVLCPLEKLSALQDLLIVGKHFPEEINLALEPMRGMKLILKEVTPPLRYHEHATFKCHFVERPF